MRAARIGPNAITRVAEVLQSRFGDSAAKALFGSAGLAAYLARPPEDMVDEAEVACLHRCLRAELGTDLAREVGRAAGIRTADYLLARRIPHAVQWSLRHLPAGLASPLLLAAIRRNAWTFVGSGRFAARAGRPARLSISGNPLCRDVSACVPVCDYYAATFEQLFRELVHPNMRAVETTCEAAGAPACVFELRW